jgi:hypothetical protein
MKKVFIDPTYANFENDSLFNGDNPFLNRDGTLVPFIKLKKDLESKGMKVHTFDLRKNFSEDELRDAGYISLGNVQNLEEVQRLGMRPLAFFLMEPPLVLTRPYKNLPQISQVFEKVFIHNVEGDCYDLSGVKTEVLRKFYWPQPFTSVVDTFWSKKNRKNSVVIINGHHRPKRMFRKELYSDRVLWGVALSKYIRVDLYGRGWDKLFSKASLWTPYLANYFKLRRIYRGSCDSKLEVLAGYDFALCFENLKMNGYITEKIFDCFYSGTIPIYRGGDDILRWIPASCFIDLRNFRDSEILAKYLKSLGEVQKQHYRESAKKFLESKEGQKYVSLYDQIFQA